jgi:hypothetical protein
MHLYYGSVAHGDGNCDEFDLHECDDGPLGDFVSSFSPCAKLIRFNMSHRGEHSPSPQIYLLSCTSIPNQMAVVSLSVLVDLGLASHLCQSWDLGEVE